MTQEMGESLIYSWLRHVKGCQIVQTNWKASPLWEMKYIEKVEYHYRVLKRFETIYGKNVIGRQTLKQILNQTECDVLGLLKPSRTTNVQIIAAEVAYHKDGLHYKHTSQKVISKLSRIAMCVYATYGNVNTKLLFVTPVIKANKLIIQNSIDALNKRLKIITNNNYSVELISDDDFKYRVIHPICLVNKGVNDNSELFQRSLQLIQLVENPTPIFNNPKSFDEFGKVGNIANIVLRYYFEMENSSNLQKYLNPNTIDSKKDFGLSKPILYKKPFILNGKPQTYSLPIRTRDKKLYYLYINWTNNQKKKLLQWLIKHW